MKKLILPLLIGVCAAAYALGYTLASAEAVSSVAPKDAAVQLVTRAFKATKATLTGYEVHDFSTIHNQFFAVSALQGVGGTLAKEFGLPGRPSYTHHTTNENTVLYKGYQNSSQGRVNSTLELMSMRFPNVPAQTVLVVTASVLTNQESGAYSEYTRVSQVVKAAGGQANINVMLIGKRSFQMRHKERLQVIQNAFAAVNGTMLQKMQVPYTTSVSGHADAAVPYLQSGSEALNLQVAVHQRNYQKDTKVLVGSPVITIEY